jgi:hydrogenase maturation factor
MSSDGEPAPRARLRAGKPPLETLTRLLEAVEVTDPRVIMGPRVGEDAAVIELGDGYLVAKADPVTLVAEDIGWYAVHVNANDLAVRGARPRWFLMTLLLPEGTEESRLEAIFAQVGEACRAVGATLVGGHTEAVRGLARPILAGAMLGEVAKDGLVTTAGAEAGDVLLLSKGIAVEGASILARECDAILAARSVPAAVRTAARGFLRRPGISVLRDAAVALEAGVVRAMHDPTEGGLATGLLELAVAGGVGLRVARDAIPVLPECAAMCRALDLDPLGLIASGALLLACPAPDADAILAAWRSAGLAGAAIGRVTPAAAGCVLAEGGTERPLPRFPRDEVARLFETLTGACSEPQEGRP